ncbi:MAG: enoyl-CoA hydratase-related protein [Desulfatirhabdiaceae bacterium]
MTYKNLIVERDGAIDIITLNRPDVLNAFSYEMIDELVEVLEKIGKDYSTWVLVLKARGRGFCSGHEVSESLTPPGMTIEEVRQLNRAMLRIPLMIHRLEKATIAAVQGVALGFGFDLASACDLRVAAEDARFCQGFLRIGLSPGMGGAWLLPRLIGMTKAAELLFSGDFFSARDADRFGMLNRLVPLEKLEEETMALARKLSKGPGAAIRLAKQLMVNGMQSDFAASLDACNTAETLTLFTNDFREGEAAFAEKRSPDFKGR